MQLTTDRPTFRFIHLVQHAMPYRKTLLLALMLMLLASALSLLSPWIAGQFTMSLLDETVAISLSLEQILLLWLVILALQAITTFANQYLLSNTSEQLLAGLRTRIYDHLQSLPLAYFHDRKR